MSGPSARLARFLAGSRWEEIPASLRQEGRRAILNIIGCMLGGRRERSIQLLESAFPATSLANAAVVHAAAANALDFDDTHLPTVIHPSAPVAGALFALTNERKLTGAQFLHAFILGVEAACRVGNAVSPGHYEHGWHITGTCGVFGAAAAAGKALELNESQFLHALGIAATQAAGLVEMLGSMTRVLNTGFAARNGLAAALLAAQGFEAVEQPLEGERGFANVFGGSRKVAALIQGLGEEWALREVAYKPYPCGMVLHALIDACLPLRKVESYPQSVEIRLHPLAVERGDRLDPRNGLEARLSAQHCAAVALVDGAAGLAQFTDDAVSRPALALVRSRVKLVADGSLDKAAAIVTVDGRAVRAEARQSMTGAELEAKFRALAGARAEELLAVVSSLEAAGELSLTL